MTILKNACFAILIFSTIPLTGQIELLDTLSHFSKEEDKLEYLSKFFSKSVYATPELAPKYANLYDSIATSLGNPKFVAQAHTIKGMSHYVNRHYDKSIEEYVAALNMEQYLTKPSDKAKVLNNLATSYQVRGDLKNSLKYFEQAHQIYKEEKDSLWIANTSGNLGLLLLNNKNIVAAEPYIRKALGYYRQNGPETYEGYTSLNLGNLLVEKRAFRESIVEFDRAIALVPESINPLVYAAASSGKGVAYNHLNQHHLSERYLTLGLEKSIEINHTDQLNVCYLELSKLYEKQGAFSKSLEHYKKHAILKDSLFTLEQDAKMVEILTKYESDIKEKEIVLLNSEKELNEVRLSNSKKVLILLGLGLLLLGTLLFRLFRLNKENKKNAQEKDTLLREIHHRVKNNLQVISALLTLQAKYVKDDLAIEALQEGQDRVHSMALIHRNLYQQDNLKGVNTKDYLEKLVENLLESYQINKANISLNLNIETIWLDVDTMIPMGLMINELVSNSLKHAFINRKDGILSISLKEEDGLIHLEVGDNGKGVTKNIVDAKNTFGQSLIKSFAKKLNAEVVYNHNDGLKVSLLIKTYKKAA